MILLIARESQPISSLRKVDQTQKNYLFIRKCVFSILKLTLHFGKKFTQIFLRIFGPNCFHYTP